MSISNDGVSDEARTPIPDEVPINHIDSADNDVIIPAVNYNYNLASSFIKDARFSRVHIPYNHDEASIRIYELYYNRWLLTVYYIALWLNLILIFFEEPISFKSYFRIPYQAVAAINLLCILYFLFRWCHSLKCSNREKFFKLTRNIATPIILVLMILDIVIYVIIRSINPNLPYVQWSRWLRPFLCATFPENYKIRAALDNIRGTLFDIVTVFLLFLFMLAFFAIIALQFFSTANLYYPNGNPYFRDYYDSIFDLYVLVTTSNSPDVILPAYERNRAFVVIYLAVTIVCNWIFIGIIVANVYNAYKTHLGNHVISTLKKKKKRLHEAYLLLKSAEHNEVDYTTFLKVMKAVEPNSTENHNTLLFRLIDVNHSNTLSIEQFTKLTEYMHLKFEEIPFSRNYFLKHIPAFYWCYMSKLNRTVIPFIRHQYTIWFFEAVIILNAISMVVLNNSKMEILAEWIFTLIFVVEVILRLFACGINLYFKEYWNCFDFVVVGLALFSLILHGIFSIFNKNFPITYLRLLLSFRVIRILKIVNVVHQFRLIVRCIIVLLPSLLAYAAIQLCIYYIYICIGMEAFGNLYFPPPNNIYELKENNVTIDCGNPKLIDSDFIRSHYCILNYNSAADGLLLMTILTVSNNWHILLTGATLTTNRIARVFFLSIHWICVLLVMNIVLAFIIDAYLMEVESSKGQFEEAIEERLKEVDLSATTELEKRGLQDFGKIHFDLSYKLLDKAFPPNSEEEGKVYFRFDEKAPKEMETLLQRMFEDDIAKLQHQFMTYSLQARNDRFVTAGPRGQVEDIISQNSLQLSKMNA